MFAPAVGLEDYSLRVEVEWLNAKRHVVVRLEQAPKPFRGAIVVCSLEEDVNEDEWLLLQPSGFPFTSPKPKDGVILGRAVRNAFAGNGLVVGRFLDFSGSVEPPNRVLIGANGSCHWLFSHRPFEAVLFDWNLSAMLLEPLPLVENELWREWQNTESDARFAWNWARWSYHERLSRLCNSIVDTSELSPLMKAILQCSLTLWDSGPAWIWGLPRDPTQHTRLYNPGFVKSASHPPDVLRWQECLYAYFVPALRQDWLDSHRCARKFWNEQRELARVQVDEPPTSHERLEARLQLRQWLEQNAPEQIDKLLLS